MSKVLEKKQNKKKRKPKEEQHHNVAAAKEIGKQFINKLMKTRWTIGFRGGNAHKEATMPGEAPWDHKCLTICVQKSV